ncbi:MAG: thioesterase family protein [Hyphomicrobium sp.]
MNLWLRLIWLLLTSRARAPLRLPDDASVLWFRVWPHDLDPSLHMNNGRYLAIMDLGRLDVMARSGLWRAAFQNRWTPIAGAIAIRFRRELPPFQAFRLETRLACWDRTLVVMEQTFVIDGGARALFKGGIYDRKSRAFVTIVRLMQTIGVTAESPQPTEEIEAFLKTDDKLRQSAASQDSLAE